MNIRRELDRLLARWMGLDRKHAVDQLVRQPFA
jgi:hypothetical protein